MRSIEQSLDAIATALSVIAASSGNPGAEALADATGKGSPPPGAAGHKGPGRPAGAPNKPKPAKPPEAAPTAAPEAEADAATDEPTAADASAAVTATIKAGFRDEVLATLAKYSAKNASGVKADERAAFIAELTEIAAVAG